MRRFVFKLEGVLEQRRHAEQQRQRDLAEAQKQILTLEREVNLATSAEKSSTPSLRGRVDPRTLAIYVRFSQVMRHKLATLRAQLAGARDDLATAREALVEASKQRKVLEKLQEKQHARWLAEQQRHETRAHEDVSQQITRENFDSSGTFPPTGS
jgi:flagellar FliJ protein